MDCRSVDGFQSTSNNTNLDAPTKFNPHPPLFELNRNATVVNISRREGGGTAGFSVDAIEVIDYLLSFILISITVQSTPRVTLGG